MKLKTKVRLVCPALLALAGASWCDTVVISSDMGAAAAANFSTTQTLDTTVQFGFDWSSYTPPAATGYSTMPASPNGDTIGLKITCNNTADPTNYQEGVTVWCTTEPQTQNYDVEVDALIAYPPGGSGTTEHIGIVIQGSGDGIRGLRNNALSGCNPAFGTWGTNPAYADLSTTASTYPQDGIAFGYDGENGESNVSSTDIFLYDPAARPGVGGIVTTQKNGQVGTWLAGDPSPYTNHDFSTYQFALPTPPPGRTEPASFAGWFWNHIKVAVRGTNITWYINGNPIVTYTSTKTAKRVGLIATDPFSSVSTPATESFMLFDNFKITDVIPSTAAHDWQLYE